MHREITGPLVWRGPDLPNGRGWLRRMTETHVAEIDAALGVTREKGLGLAEMTVEDFPLPAFSEDLAEMRRELEEGTGAQLYRGFPVADYSKDDLRTIYWGIGLHVGWAVSQSKRGDLLGDVRDIGTPRDGPAFRGYTSSGELTFHTDAADVTGLFCLHPAKSGGISRIVSAAAIHNEILRTRPDLLDVLYGNYWWSRQGNELPGQEPYYTQPIFADQDGYFASRYTPTHIRSATQSGTTPPPTDAQIEALGYVEELNNRPEFYLEMTFEAGDIQFLNNHLTYHMRTEFEDFGEPERKRHLLRLWLSIPNSRPLSQGFAPFFGDVGAGAVRGGFPGHGAEAHFVTA